MLNVSPYSTAPGAGQSANKAYASTVQQSRLLGALNNPSTSAQHRPSSGISSSGHSASNSLSGGNTLSASAILATLNGSSSSSSSNAAQQQQDSWLTGTQTQPGGGGSSHIPSSLAQSINNPGVPSGAIVSSAAVNGLAGLNGGFTRSETPAKEFLAGAGSHQSGGTTGKLLLQKNALPGMSSGGQQGQSENEKVYYLIVDLMNPATREGALLELSKKREQWDDLALVLWHSFGSFLLSHRHGPHSADRWKQVSCRRSCKKLFLYTRS